MLYIGSNDTFSRHIHQLQIDSAAKVAVRAGNPPKVRRFRDRNGGPANFRGLALGYPHESQPVNRLQTERAPLEEFAEFRGL